jgi:hypothetical protein
MVLIGDLVREFVAQKPIEEGLQRNRIFQAWDALMAESVAGPCSAQEAAKLTLRKYYADRTLTCKMASSMVRMHLQMEVESLRKRLNDRLPEPLVDKIVLQ